jgi:hypothetical protein
MRNRRIERHWKKHRLGVINKALATIVLTLVITSVPIIGFLNFAGGNPPAEAFVGSHTDCENFEIDMTALKLSLLAGGLLTPWPPVLVGGLLVPFDADLTDEGWVWVDPNQKFKDVSGIVKRSHMAPTDLSPNHYSHDQIAEILVDQEYLSLVSDANANLTGPNADVIEMEWEAGILPPERSGEGNDPFFPLWAWPSINDRVWTNGHWVFDCGHGVDKDGVEQFRSEIHAARAIASMRTQVITLPGTGITPVEGVSTDLYIHGRGGFMVQQLNCGMHIIVDGVECEDPDDKVTPIAENFTFNIILPAKPFPSAILGTSISDGPGNNINVDPILEVFPDENPPRVNVIVPLDGSGAVPTDVYARHIKAGWVAPADVLKHQALSLDLMKLEDDREPDPGDCECSFFWLNVDREPEKEWIRLADFTNDEEENDSMDDYDGADNLGGGWMGFSRADFDYYVADDMPLGIRANGYDQDCLDDWFNNHHLTVERYAACMGLEIFFFDYGDNDRFPRVNGTLFPEDYYGCPPGSSSRPPAPSEVGRVITYTLCHEVDGQIRFSAGQYNWFEADDLNPEPYALPKEYYRLYFTLEEIPLTDEDSADLSISKTCEPGTAQSIDCTIIVENYGPGLPRDVVVQDTVTTDAPSGSYTLGTPKFTIENSYKTGPFDCTVTPPDQFSCDLGTVPVEGRANITFTVSASQPGTFDDLAVVTTESDDPNSDNDEAQFRVIVVDIDVKPGDSKNTISINNDKSVRVAILGTEDFDVSSVDISPLSDAPKFGGRTPRGPVATSLEDVSKDGIADLVMKYNEGPKNPLGFRTGDTQGCITGKLTDGTPILGCDTVRVIK